MKPERLRRFVAIDPGDVHCGVAYFEDQECRWATEFSPSGLLMLLEGARLGNLDDHGRYAVPGVQGLVVERFQLYGDRMGAQVGSDMRTSQLIGALRLASDLGGLWMVQQQAALKTPTENLIRHRGIRRESLGEGGHARDAETHGYTFLWKTSQNPNTDYDGGWKHAEDN